MTPEFKFLRRVRIHGGECGAVARALHHEVKGSSLYQADLGKYSGSTNERKQMSTKTTLKRIALVAVSALGFGLLSVTSSSATVPANKNIVDAISFGVTTTDGSTARVARAGVGTTIDIKISTGSGGYTVGSAEVFDIVSYVRFSSVPSGETLLGTSTGSGMSPVLAATTVAAGSLTTTNAGTFTAAGVSGTTPAKLSLAVSSAGEVIKSLGTGTVKIGTATFTPSVAGTYKVLGWVDDGTAGNTNTALDAAERSSTKTITVGGAPTALVVTKLNASAAVSSANVPTGNKGTVFQVSVTDTAGNRTALLPGEAVGVTKASGDGSISDASLTAGDFNGNGYAYVTIEGTADQTGTFVFASSGFTATSVTQSATATLANAKPASVTFSSTTTGLLAGSGVATSFSTAQTDDFAVTITTGKALSLRVTSGSSAAATSRVASVMIIDNFGIVSGDDNSQAGLGAGTVKYSLAVAIDDTLGYGSVTLPTSGLAEDEYIQVVWTDAAGAEETLTVTAQDPVISATSTLTPAASNIVTGGGIELTARCLDQFGSAVASCAVSWSVTGRNLTAVPTQKLADANGYSTYTLNDTSTSTTSLTSTVSALMTYGASTNTETASVTFGAGNAIDSITVTTSPTKTVATTESSISTAVTGPEGGAVTLAFTVKDATGVVLVGVPVTFTADSTNVSWKSSSTDTANRQLAYTDSSGVATTYIAGWVAPSTVTVTATAGTKTVTTKVNLVTVATDARTIALSTSGGIVKATVKDRFGNPTKGATVNWSRVGTGYFGSGVSATTGTTDVNGEAEILFIGDGTIKAELAVATYAQCDDASGFVSTTATSGTGASLAPAGICSATSAVTGSKDSATKAADAATAAAEAATDAAAEAIDAANAATDAANLSAEAADAATVAAEEARDAADAATAAVEELATQVATLMAALKAQITTLANTVAKIAKKVKA